MKKIKYIGYYDIQENAAENRNYALSAANKMTYIISALAKIGYNVDIISASETRNNQGYPGKTIKIDDTTNLKLFKTFKLGNKLNKFISIISLKVFLILYLMINIKRNESVILYHSLAYLSIFKFLKKIKKFNLILEVEEVYADVINSDKYRKKEYDYFKYADAYIFPTELLNDKINTDNKPYTIIYGTYQVEPDRECKFNDGKIHCVYAGIFDPEKGSIAAADTALYLNNNYHVHIIGFGNERDKNNLINKIEEISRSGKCTITYDGIKSGEDYIRFIQSCDIGFCTQNIDTMYNETSFPSKVLSYMSNGLRVVSVRIKALETSAVNDYLYYYENNTPEAIAETVKNISLNDGYDSRKLIKELDTKFTKDLNIMIRNFEV
jgi:hypothetical protein